MSDKPAEQALLREFIGYLSVEYRWPQERWENCAKLADDFLNRRERDCDKGFGTEQAYHARGAGRWVAIADGEGAEARPLFGDKPHQEFHDFMCVCGQPWKECTTDGMREDIAKIDDPDEWTLDEAGKQFSAHWEHECGKVSLYRVRVREPGADTGTTPSRDCVWIVEQNGAVHSVHSTYESAYKEEGENLRIGVPWQVLPWREAERGTPPPRFSEVIDAWQAANHATGSLADMLDSLKEFASVYRAATQRAPVEQGRVSHQCVEVLREIEETLRRDYDPCLPFVAQFHGWVREKLTVAEAAAPDHAREGALHDRVVAMRNALKPYLHESLRPEQILAIDVAIQAELERAAALPSGDAQEMAREWLSFE